MNGQDYLKYLQRKNWINKFQFSGKLYADERFEKWEEKE